MAQVGNISQVDSAKVYLYKNDQWAKIYPLINNKNIEAEVRYRDVKLLVNTAPSTVKLNHLIPDNRITANAYQRLIDFYKNNQNFNYSTTIDVVKKYNNDIRSINANNNISYQQKTKINRWPIHSQLGFTIAISKEIELNDVNNLIEKPYSQRRRNRQSFTFIINNIAIYKIDLTEVRIDIDSDLQSTIKAQPKYSTWLPAVLIFDDHLLYYSLEIEYLANQQKGDNINYWETFRLAAFKLLALLQNTSIPYTIEDKYKTLNQCNQILWSIFVNGSGYEDRDQIKASLLTQPRNLRMNEITWGQLFGHTDIQRTFYVTPKADGERRLLFITKTAIWLIAPPDRVSKVVSTDSKKLPLSLTNLLTRYDNAIFDGELVPAQNWRIAMGTPGFNAPRDRSVNWFLLFDCICLGYSRDATKDDTVKLNDKTKLPLASRLDDLKEFQKDWNQIADLNIDGLKLQINLKSHIPLTAPTPIKHMGPYALYKNEHPANIFFIQIRQQLAKLGLTQQSTEAGNLSQFLPYVTDGLIFTPAGTYDPSANNLSLTERRLDKVMDVLKWKPQTDFTIDLAVSINGTDYKLEATSSGKYDKNYLIVKYKINNNTISKLQNLPPRTVVEFAVNIVDDDIELNFRRLRPDKRYPNDVDIVNDNINLTRNPILADTLAGYNFKLMSTYHGTIKKSLFDSIADGAVGLEIGAGQGGDLYKMARFSKVYSVEPNDKNIIEYKRRLNNLIKIDNRWASRMVLIKQRAELPISKDIIADNSVDFVSLMLCLTFFWDPSGIALLLAGLFKNINRVLKPGGVVILLTMDGNAVQEEFGLTGVDSFYLHPSQLTRQPVRKRLHRFGLGLESRNINNTNSYDLPFNAQTPTELAIDSEIHPADAYIQVLDNGQIHINIPGSIVEQNESLVYLQDIGKIAPNFSLIKKDRADQQLLLPYGHYQLSRMYTFGTLAKRYEDQVVQGSQTLTPSELTYNIMNLESGVVSSNNFDLLQPLPVQAPLVATEAAQGDGVVEELPVNYIKRANFDVVNNQVQQANINQSLTFIDAFRGLRIGKVATIFENPDNFFHAFLKATLAQYQNDRAYGDRVQLARLTRQAFIDFLLGNSYVQIATTEMQAPDPNTFKMVPFIGNNSNGLYTLDYLHNYANQLNSNAIGFDPGLASFVALLYKVHIIIISSSGNGILANSKADLPTEDYKRSIVLLAYQHPDQQLPYHYEPIVLRNADGLNQSLFDSNSNFIQDLSDSFVIEENYNNSRAAAGL